MRIDDRLKIDTTALIGLVEESRDLHADAMRGVEETLPELAQLAAERKGEVDTDDIDRFNHRRRRVLAGLGGGAGAIAARGVLGGGLGGLLGGLLAGLLATPARADTALDVQILQTASSLEALAVATYALALGQGPDKLDDSSYKAVAGIPVKSAKDTLVTFATETMRQHLEHKKAFQAQTTALDANAKVQDAPNPTFLPKVASADLSTPEKLVDFAAVLEKVATDTYLLNLTMLQDTKAKVIMGSVMAVEAQHLATLRAVGALLKGAGGAPPAPQLVNVPFPVADIAKLPKGVATVAFPDAFEKINGADGIADPKSGALR